MDKLSVSNDKWVGWDYPIAVVYCNGRTILQQTLELKHYDLVILDKELVEQYPELVEMSKVYAKEVKVDFVEDGNDELIVNTPQDLYEYNLIQEHK